MGYIDKQKMLHDLSVKMGDALLNGRKLDYAVWEMLVEYVKMYPEEKAPSILDDDDVGVTYGDMMG